MMAIVKIFRNIYNPVSKFIHERWAILFPKWYARYVFKKVTDRKLDLNNPKHFQEKIQWLKIYSDTSMWTDLADKYKVRDYVSRNGFSDILVELYGVWKNAEEIDFSKLPGKFVLKTTHGFGKVIVVEDKNKLDIGKTVRQLNKWVKERYGLLSFEPHYWNIDRRIIAEEFLQDNSKANISSSLIDYKFYCIQGEPAVISCLIDRENMNVGSNVKKDNTGLKELSFDLDWNPRPEILSDYFPQHNETVLTKPNRLDEMINICRILSKPFPAVRIDLYEVNNKVYFGEMTFTPGGGLLDYTDDFYLEMGQKLDLTRVKLRTKRSII